MKRIIIFGLIMFFDFAFSQSSEIIEKKDFKLNVGIELKAYFPLNISEKYISDGYSQNIGSELNALLIAQEKFGLGLNYSINNSKVENTNIVGLFEEAKFWSYLFYAFYTHKFYQKYAISGKIGLGKATIKHTGSDINVFRLTYNQYVLGLQFQYFFKDNFYALAYNDFIFLQGKDISVNTQDKDYFTKSTYTHTGIGIGYQF